MTKKTIGVVILLVGAWLVLSLTAAEAASAPTPPGTAVRAAATANGQVRVCQTPLCRLRCVSMTVRKRCRPGTVCRFVGHGFCRCTYLRGTCSLHCRPRPVTRVCDRGGMCLATLRRCQCGVPMRPQGPR